MSARRDARGESSDLAGRLLRWYGSVDPVLAYMREAGLLSGRIEEAAARVFFLLSDLERRWRRLPDEGSIGHAVGDAGGDAFDRKAIRREAERICDEHVRARGGVYPLALALDVADGLIDQIEREVRVALDRVGKAQDRAERDVREFHEENIQLRDRVAQLEESARETERVREEDQRRRDELDRFPGAGAG